MKILQIMASSGGVGGLEQHTFSLTNQLALNHDVHVIAHECYRKNFVATVHFHAFDFSRSRWNILALYQLTCQINQIHPQILHAQAGKAAQLIQHIRPFLKPLKIVTTVHGTKKNKSAYCVGDGIITVSQALTQSLPVERTQVIYNGIVPQVKLTQVEKDTLKQKVYGQYPQLDSNKKIVMCIGRLEPVKNIALLIDAMQQVDANCWIVGDGSLKSELENQVQQLNLQDRVVFLGYRADARDLIQIADIVCLSSDREGFPLVMVEALQAEKPLVSTRVSGVVEWLPDPYLVDVGDSNGLAQALQHALSTEPHLELQALYLRAQNELTVEAMAQQTLDFYQKL